MTGFAPGTGGERPRNNPIWNIDSNLNWQRGTHSLRLRRIVHAGGLHPHADHRRADGELRHPGRPRSGGRDVQHDELPGRVDQQPDRPARALRVPDRPRDAINGQARLNPESKYVYIGPTTDDMRLTELGAYAQDSWRVTPGPDAERRRAVGTAAAHRGAQRQLLDGDDGRYLRAVGPGSGPGRP